MSWKIYLIIITNAANTELSEIPKLLGTQNLGHQKELTMMEAQYMQQGVSIGKYEDKIFIVSQQFVFDLLENESSEIKKKLLQAFPDSEIAVLTTGFLNGFSILKNQKVERTWVGFDLRTTVDTGDKLAEEIEAYKEISEDHEMMAEIKEDYPDDFEAVITENASEGAVFKLTKRYFGQRIDEDGSDFDKITMTHYE
ncbi:hypothetical protein SAMN05443633_11234 [Chryseobacterium arachidis]|uniref:Uncharacterized protein n=1 Tax=Chryseobacterium arachidis TaxID=1416778 RepID=A0A1M5I9E7_9FLAO|nr:hypothetical protein [Chryseobacterium arachidis]SHG24403.1 hypothetical protein SAMN05443633_11234 [Chryseobacterium arachidis]